MVDIIEVIQQYTPQSKEGKLSPLFFGGDQLTRERAVHAQEAKSQSSTALGRLQGVIPKAEDWHTLVTFYQVGQIITMQVVALVIFFLLIQVIWLQLYKDDSFMDKGTLKQLQNLINRTNVPKVVKNNYSAANKFYSLVLEAHIVCAGMQFFGMENQGDDPKLFEFPENLAIAQLDDKKAYLKRVVGNFVDKFALGFINEHSQLVADNNEELDDPQFDEDDAVYNYASAVIGYGLLANDFEDAYKEGDGERTIRLWKFFLLHFKTNGRTKYALEAFNLIAQVNALLSARKAHQLIWNRTCSTNNYGENKPLDLQNEHLNRVLKDDINTYRAQLTQRSIERTGHAIGATMQVLTNFDRISLVKPESGKHPEPLYKEDLDTIVEELKTQEVFTFRPGRKHESFPDFPSDPLLKLKKNKSKQLQNWLQRHRKQAAIDQSIQLMKF